MSKEYPAITREIKATLRTIRQEMPSLISGFGALNKGVSGDGVLDRKTKELMALALAIGKHCDACIAFHMETLVGLGVTRQEVLETIGIAVLMDGGPSMMYGAGALRAYEQFSGDAGPSR